jgi:hypothetical protein
MEESLIHYFFGLTEFYKLNPQEPTNVQIEQASYDNVNHIKNIFWRTETKSTHGLMAPPG